jgi:hypothetical protein
MTNGEAPSNALATLEKLSKAAVAALGAVYALGLAVVTLHMASYGASGLGLLHEQYVLAGMWALFPLGAIGFVFTVIFGAAVEEFDKKQTRSADVGPDARPVRRWREIGIKIGGVAMLSFSWLLISGFFLGFVASQIDRSSIAAVGIWALLTIAAKVTGFGVMIAIMLIGGIAGMVDKAKPNRPFAAVLLTTALIVMMGYLGFFTASVYPLIPAAVGGGQPRRVQVLLKSDPPGAAMAALLRGTSLPELLSEHRLLFATDQAYIVVDPGDQHRAIEIPKELVTAVRTIGR